MTENHSEEDKRPFDTLASTDATSVLSTWDMDEDADWEMLEWWFAAAEAAEVIESDYARHGVEICRNREEYSEDHQRAVIIYYDLKMDAEFGERYRKKQQTGNESRK